MDDQLGILDFFEDMDDPRVMGRCRHNLIDILAITICASICGADEWTEIQLFGNAKKEWFSTWLELPGGIPSHDTFGRVFQLLDPEEFEARFSEWVNMVTDLSDGDIIAIDGKTLRRSYDTASDKAAIHMVSAWAHENGMVLGQVATDEKSNEITAIPELLSKLNITGSTVTIDAMGCQKTIASAIIQGGGDYVLALKNNQKGLRNEVIGLLDDTIGKDFDLCRQAHIRRVNDDHGRKEVRDYWLVEDWLFGGRKSEWEGIKSFGKVVSKRTIDGKTSEETRYFITSLPCKVKQFAKAVRSHWSIENSLHWSLDVTFKEDESRIRKGHGATNMAVIRRFVLSALKKTEGISKKMSIKAKRKLAGWDHPFLLRVLRGI
jgi:predicted transposase YbfD/YdcC